MAMVVLVVTGLAAAQVQLQANRFNNQQWANSDAQTMHRKRNSETFTVHFILTTKLYSFSGLIQFKRVLYSYEITYCRR